MPVLTLVIRDPWTYERSVLIRVTTGEQLTSWASRAISAHVGVSLYSTYAPWTPTVLESRSSVAALSHVMRGIAARMIVGVRMVVVFTSTNEDV
jgi:hypothetical protein